VSGCRARASSETVGTCVRLAGHRRTHRSSRKVDFIPRLPAPSQVLSRDSVTVSVDAVVYYRVSNPTMATNNIEDYR